MWSLGGLLHLHDPVKQEEWMVTDTASIEID